MGSRKADALMAMTDREFGAHLRKTGITAQIERALPRSRHARYSLMSFAGWFALGVAFGIGLTLLARLFL